MLPVADVWPLQQELVMAQFVAVDLHAKGDMHLEIAYPDACLLTHRTLHLSQTVQA